MFLQLLLISPLLQLKLMMIFRFQCQTLQLPNHLQGMILQEQVKMLNQDALTTLSVLPSILS